MKLQIKIIMRATRLAHLMFRNFIILALDMIAWACTSTASESTLTPSACYAASTNQWTETT
jgi:hypothetical protein